MALRLRCAECGATTRLPDSRYGRKNYCPRCDARLPDEPADRGGGLVLALVLGGITVFGILVLGAGVAVWLVAKRPAAVPAAAVAQAPPQPEPLPAGPAGPLPAGPPAANLDPLPPPMFDPPGPRAPGPAVPPAAPEFRPPGPPGPPPPGLVARELKLPPAPPPVDIRPAPITGPTDVALPEAPERAAVGGAGRFLVLHFPKTRTLGVFDANLAKLRAPYINLPEDKVHFACGMDKLAVLLPGAGVIRRYDLLTGKLELSKPFAVKGVTAFALGHSSAGPLVVRGADGSRLYDLTTFAEIPLPVDPANNQLGGPGPAAAPALPFDGGEIWAGGNGRVFGNTGNWGMPNGVRVVSLEGGKVTLRSEHTSTWFVQPSPDGKYVFAGGHKPVTADLKPSPDLVESGLNGGGGNASSMYLPAHHGPYYLAVGSGDDAGFVPRGGAARAAELRVHLYGLAQPVARIPLPAGGAAPAGAADWAQLQQLPTAINLIPRANLLVVRGGDKLRLIPVDLEKELEKSGLEFLVVTSAPPAHYKPGTEFRYPVRAKSRAGGIEYKLDAAPDGMAVAADGTITWRPAAGLKDAVSVILNLKDKAGKEAFHTFALSPEPDGAAVAQAPDRPPVPAPEPPKPPPAKAAVHFPATPARLPIKPVGGDERKTVPLPDAAARALPAGGGRFIAFHFPKTRQAGVFDVNELKVVRYINLPEDNPLLAAGMTKLAVYLPGAKVIRRYDLLTGKQELSKPFDVPEVKALALGSASAGPLAVAAAGGGRLFDLDTLAEIELPKEDVPDRFGRAPDAAARLPLTGPNVWAAANGRMFVGAGVVSLEGGRVKVIPGHGEGWMFAQPSADGRHIFRGGAGASTADGKKADDVVYSNPGQGGFAGYFFLPAADGPFYFHVHFGGGLRGYEPRFQKDPEHAVTVYMYGLDTPLARVRDLKDVPDWGHMRPEGMPLTEQVMVIPRARALLTLGPSRDKLTVVPLDLNRAIDEAGIDFLLVTSAPPGSFCPGKEFRYPVRARSRAGGLKFSLESGPDGMKVGLDGVVTWAVPAAFAEPEVTVVLNVKDAAGKEAFHTFRLGKSDRPEEYVPDPEPEPARPPAKAAGPRVGYRLPAAPAAPAAAAPEVDQRTEVLVPEKFDAAVPAGGGRLLVLHARAAKKAFVFDAATLAIARTIELGDDKAVVAAGMTQLLVYRPGANEIEKFNLLTGASEAKKAIPTRGVTELVMGSASAGPLFVRAGGQAELYDVEALLPMDLPRANGFPFTGGRVWPSADGRVWANSASPAAGPVVRVAVLSENAVRVTAEPAAATYAVPAPDGRRVYVGGYGELTDDLAPAGRNGRPIQQEADPRLQFLPAADPAHFLVLHLGPDHPPAFAPRKPTARGVSVWDRERRAAVFTLDNVPELGPGMAADPGLPGFVHVIPGAGLLVVVAPTRDRLAVYPFPADGREFPAKKPIAWRLPDVPPAAALKPTALKEKTTVGLPGRKVSRVCAGGGGRYLVFEAGTTIAVLDTAEARIVSQMAAHGNVEGIAAGMSKLVVASRVEGKPVLSRYDLVSGKLEASAGGPADARGLAMGSASDGPILVQAGGRPRFYDLAKLAPLEPAGPRLADRPLESDGLAAAADGRTFAALERVATTVHRAVVFRLDRDGIRTVEGEPGRIESVALAADGGHVFLGGRGIVTADLKKATDVVAYPDDAGVSPLAVTFAPAAEGPYYLHLHLGARTSGPQFAWDPLHGVTLYRYGAEAAVGRLPNVVPTTTRTTASREWVRVLRPAGAFHFLPSARLLVAVDPSLTRVHLLPVDPDNMPAVAAPRAPAKVPRPGADPGPAARAQFRLPPVPEPLPITPPAEARTYTFGKEPLGISPVRVRLAGGGRFVLVQRAAQKIDIFDLNEQKVVRQIELAGTVSRWVAGRTKLFASDNDYRVIRRYDLLTGKMDLDRTFPRQLIVMALGSAVDGPVICQDGATFRFVDGDNLNPMDLAAPELTGQEYFNKTVWASPDGRTYAVGAPGAGLMGRGPADGFRTVTLRVGPAGVRKEAGSFPALYALPDPTGGYLFAGGHGAFDVAFKKTPDVVRSEDPSPQEPPVHFYFPAQDGPFYFRYVLPFELPRPGAPPAPPPAPRGGAETDIQVFAFGQAKPVAVLKAPDPLAGEGFNPFALGRLADHLFLVPAARALVVVSMRGDKISLVRFDPEAEMAKSGVEVPWVTSAAPRTFRPGTPVKYDLKVASKAGGVKFALDDPADGMAVSANGVFTWAPPENAPAEVRVTIRVTDGTDHSSVQSFPLTRQ